MRTALFFVRRQSTWLNTLDLDVTSHERVELILLRRLARSRLNPASSGVPSHASAWSSVEERHDVLARC
jgi:hypothetical protein